MGKSYLLPYYFKKIGLVLLLPSIGLLIYSWIEGFVFWSITIPSISDQGIGINKVDVGLTVIIIVNMLSLLLIGLSKEKHEDKCIAQIRANALVWGMWISNILIMVSSVFIYDIAYISALLFYLIFFLVIYIVKFRLALARFYKLNNSNE